MYGSLAVVFKASNDVAEREAVASKAVSLLGSFKDCHDDTIVLLVQAAATAVRHQRRLMHFSHFL